MKIYKLNKFKLTMSIIIIAIILPISINILFINLFKAPITDLYNKPIGLFFSLLLIFFFVSEYFTKIEINDVGISRYSLHGSFIIEWKELTKLVYTKKNKRLTLFGTQGQRLLFQNNISNYKYLYLNIFEQIKLHHKESVVDQYFFDFVYSIKI